MLKLYQIWSTHAITHTGKAVWAVILKMMLNHVILVWKGRLLTCRQPSAGSAELVRPGGIVPNLSRSPSTRPNLSRSPSRRAEQGPRRFQALLSALESFEATLLWLDLIRGSLTARHLPWSDWYSSNQNAICEPFALFSTSFAVSDCHPIIEEKWKICLFLRSIIPRSLSSTFQSGNSMIASQVLQYNQSKPQKSDNITSNQSLTSLQSINIWHPCNQTKSSPLSPLSPWLIWVFDPLSDQTWCATRYSYQNQK